MKTRKTKKACPGPPALSELIARLTAVEDHEVATTLAAVRRWDWPRTDLQCWVDVLNRFDAILERDCVEYALPQIQMTAFTPRTKQTLLEILRFLQLLLENSTNRKIFSSYDRLNDLLLTCDIDVLEGVLKLALRPAQQYRRTDSLAEERLLHLVASGSARDYGWDMVQVASADTPAPLATAASPDVSYKFYRRDGPRGDEGLTTITVTDLGSADHASRSDVDLMADAADAHRVPAPSRLGLLQKIRVARHLDSVPTRRRLLAIRCLALAVVSSLASDQTLQAKLFVYEPDLVARLAELLRPERPIAVDLRTAALHALEGLSRVRSKSSEVLAAVGVSVNHGILMQLLRTMAAEVDHPESEFVRNDFVDALFGFLVSLHNHHQHVGASLVGAGVVPLLVDLVRSVPPDQLPIATRAVGFLESASYAFTSASTALFGAEGIPTYVNRVRDVVDEAASPRAPVASTSHAEANNDPSDSSGLIPQSQAAFLKAIFRSLARMMSSNSTADALRNLIDSSLPETVKKIIEHRRLFGPQIYALALNVMMTFVHNEPTSLSILQEKGLPEAFYASIDDVLDASIDVISAVPNAIGALCLNEAGLNAFKSRAKPVFQGLLSVLLLDGHVQILLERENASMFGATMDEIIRHHPSLKSDVFTTLDDLMKRALDLAQAGPSLVPSTSLVDSLATTDVPSEADSKAEKSILLHLEVLAKFLEGICQNQAHSKEIAKSPILETLTAIVASPAMSAGFSESSACNRAVTSLFRVMSDSSNVACLSNLIRRTKLVMGEFKETWHGDLGEGRLEILVGPAGPSNVESANKLLVRLRQVYNLLLIFQGIVPHITYTQSRGVISSALSTLSGEEETSNVLVELSSLVRLCSWEAARLQQPIGPPASSGAAAPSPALLDGSLVQAAREAASRGSTPVPTQEPASTTSMITAREHNVRLVKPVLRGLMHSFRAVFSAIIARPPPRRTPDAHYRTEARRFSSIAGRILAADLCWRSAEDFDDLAYAVIALNGVRELIVQERWTTCTSAALSVSFQRHGGLDRVCYLYNRFATLCSDALATGEGHRAEHIMATLQGDENSRARMKLLQGVSGLRVALELIGKMVSRRIIPEGASQGDAKVTEKDVEAVSPSSFMIDVRYQLLPLLASTWRAPYLESLPPANVRLIYRSLLVTIEGDGELESQWSSGAGAQNGPQNGMSGLHSMLGFPMARAPFQLDETRVQQVMDMGFPRGAAVHALQRYQNNGNAAAEYLLQHPAIVAQHSNLEPPARPESPDVRDQNTPQPDVVDVTPTTSTQDTSRDADMVDQTETKDDQAATAAARDAAEELQRHKDELVRLREALKADFIGRAITILGTFSQLIFDIRDACKSSLFVGQAQGVDLILSALQQPSAAAICSEPAESTATAVLRLLVLMMADSQLAKEVNDRRANITRVLVSLASLCDESPLPGSELPRWLSPLLLALLSVFSLSDALRKGDDSKADIVTDGDFQSVLKGPAFETERRTAFNVCVKVLRSTARDEDTLSAVVRLIAFLTREPETAHRFLICDGVTHLVRLTATNSTMGVQEPVMMTLRHVVEASILKDIILSEISEYMKRQRLDAQQVEIPAFCNGLKHAAMRDSVGFLRSVVAAVKIANDDVDTYTVSAARLAAADNVGSHANPNGTAHADFGPKTTNADAKNVIRLLMGRLHDALTRALGHDNSQNVRGSASATSPMKRTTAEAAIVEAAPELPSSTPTHESSNQLQDFVEVRFLVTCLVELLHSYTQCKTAFIQFGPMLAEGSPHPSDAPAFLDFVLADVLPMDPVANSALPLIDGKPGKSESQLLRVSEWAELLLAALCATPPASTEANDSIRSVQEEVVDALIRAFQAANKDAQATEKRHARIGALTDLCMRLLADGPSDSRRGPRPREESYTSIAKIMIQKNFAGTLVSTISEIDLNYPSVESLLDRLLKPLYQLSKLITKVGPPAAVSQSQDSNAPLSGIRETTTSSNASSMSEDDQDGSGESHSGEDDPYRTSALGMYEGELEPGGMDHDAYDEGDDFEEEDDEMDMLDDLAGPAPIIPSDESEDEGDAAQGFAEEEMDDEDIDLGDEDMQRTASTGFRDGIDQDDDDDDEMDDDESDRDDDVSAHMGRIGHDDPEEDWDDLQGDESGFTIVASGADQLANELAEQLDEMRADGAREELNVDHTDDEHLDDGESEGGTESDEDLNDPLEMHDGLEMELVDDLPPSGVTDGRIFGGIGMARSFDTAMPGGAIAAQRADAENTEPRILGANNGLGGPRDGLRDVATHSLFVDTDSTSRPAHTGSEGRHSVFGNESRRGLDNLLGHGTFALLEQVMQGLQAPNGQGMASLFGNLAGLPGAEVIIETGDGQLRGTTARIRGHPHQRHHHHHHHSNQSQSHHRHRSADDAGASQTSVPIIFTPASTALRWDQEARLFYGAAAVADRTRLFGELVLAVLRPGARQARQARTERLRAEEESRAQAAVDKTESEAQAEEADGLVQRDVTGGPADASDPSDTLASSSNGNEAMQGVSAETPTLSQTDAVVALAHALSGTATQATDISLPEGGDLSTPATSEPPQTANEPTESETPASISRVTIQIHGETVDITNTGIDPTFLEALPDDMREEIVNQHFREVRPAAMVGQAAPSSISPEFLDALPPAIRAEVLQQEAMEQQMRHRGRESREGQTPRMEAASTAEELDPASFFGAIDDSGLRESVMMQRIGGSEDFGGVLPAGLSAEVDALRQRIGIPIFGGLGRPRVRRRGGDEHGNSPTAIESEHNGKRLAREPVQLVDKNGVATLIRLLFLPQPVQHSVLHNMLVNLCAHPKTRLELINLLLSILQDGTRDMQAAQRTYANVSRSAAKASATPKLSAKRSRALADNLYESTPDMVAQRCLDTLTHLVSANSAAPVYFLLEQDDQSAHLRRPHSAKKVKGKERERNTATVLPLNTLLDLLERPSFLATQALMESLTTLLAAVTRPLLEFGKTSDDGKGDSKANLQNGAEDAASQSASADVMQVDGSPSAAPKEPQKLASGPLKRLPSVPAETLRLLVNVLDGECSSRTFQQTLTAIQHASHLEGAKDILSAELVHRAELYTSLIQKSLEDLAGALTKANAQSDVPADLMALFTPSTANQAKLLRVLKTLEYLHLKISKSSPSPSEAKTVGDENDQARLNDILFGLHFSSLWRLVGDCLGAIDDKPDLVHMATVLLPLIEALLVVAKSLGTNFSRLAREAMSPVAERQAMSPREALESTFLAFTKRHKKMLNILVRNNPSLVSGSFSILVKAPGVLDFEAKRNFFNAQLHKRSGERRQYGTIPLNIRRAYLFEDTFQALHRRSAAEIKHGRISVRFYNEEGVDAGGLTRDWATQLVKRIFNPNYALFAPSSSDALVWQPNPQSYVNPDHLAFFAFVGRIIAKFVYDGRLLDAFFCRSFYKHLLGIPVSVSDLESVDPDSYRSLTWMLENDIDGVLDLSFSTETDAFGVETTVDLKPGGREIPVTNANKRDYVELVATHRLTLSISEQINAFVTGFTEIVPRDLISVFSPQELQLLISGLPDIDADEWRAATDYAGGLTAASPSVAWFWRAVRAFSQEERAKLLQFATGSSRVPLEGFGALQGSSGVTRFTIVGAHTTDALPSAHTCFNQLDLPNYSSYESLREKLHIAISETEGFGFA